MDAVIISFVCIQKLTLGEKGTPPPALPTPQLPSTIASTPSTITPPVRSGYKPCEGVFVIGLDTSKIMTPRQFKVSKLIILLDLIFL
jgi:hypothetical protein